MLVLCCIYAHNNQYRSNHLTDPSTCLLSQSTNLHYVHVPTFQALDLSYVSVKEIEKILCISETAVAPVDPSAEMAIQAIQNDLMSDTNKSSGLVVSSSQGNLPTNSLVQIAQVI